MNWKEILTWKESKERQRTIRKRGVKIMLVTTMIGILVNIFLYFERGFFPEMILIQLFWTGIGSWGLITGHELPEWV